MEGEGKKVLYSYHPQLQWLKCMQLAHTHSTISWSHLADWLNLRLHI